jgi:MFS family permease
VWGNTYLRSLQLTTVTFDLFWNALYAVYILYVTRTLVLPPSAIGVIFGIGSVGALVGAVMTVPVMRYLGLGRTLISMQCILGLGSILIALAMWLPASALPLLVGAEFVQSLVATIFGINRGTITQVVTPDRLRGCKHPVCRPRDRHDWHAVGWLAWGNTLGYRRRSSLA